ncbi:MAG: RidA family protein [Eubacterium sp.]|jgi:2-iminobutanoate/2-iminopropanoate deaminase
MNKPIIADKAPAAVGPYVHAVQSGNALYVSGQLGLDPVSGQLPAGIEAQAEQSLKNLGEVLTAAGYDYEDVVKTTVFLTDLSNFGIVNEIYARFFGASKPARSCVEVSKLPKDGLVEIECVAARD